MQVRAVLCVLFLGFILVLDSATAATTLDFTRVNPGDYKINAGRNWPVTIWTTSDEATETSQELQKRTFRLGDPRQLELFKLAVEALLELEEAQDNDPDYQKSRFHISGEAKKGLKEILALVAIAQGDADEKTKNDALVHITEIAFAFYYSFLPPLPKQDVVIDGGCYLIGDCHKVGASQLPMPALNLDPAANVRPGADSSKADPIQSSFWKKPKLIAGNDSDAYYGFGRNKRVELKDCSYEGPKKGYGIHGGFKIKCVNGNDTEKSQWKIKFGNEVHVGPFNTRILHLLGFNIFPHDFVSGVEIPYFDEKNAPQGRKLIAEYNSRKDVFVEATAFFGAITVEKINIQGYLNPLTDAVAGARLKDGTKIDAATLAKNLLGIHSLEAMTQAGKAAFERKKALPLNFNPEFEQKIAALLIRDASVEAVDKKIEELGTFNWNGPANRYRRDMRGFGLLAAWLNMFDMRRDNTALVLDRRDGKHALVHVIADAGSGLGKAMALPNEMSSLGTKPIAPRTSVGVVNDFEWYFTEKVKCLPQCRLKVLGYESLEAIDPFNAMTVEDAKWMARQIAQLTENQIKLALIAAGFSSAEVRLYAEKLISRRDNLLLDLGLAEEIKLLRPHGPAVDLEYMPARHGLMTATVNGRQVPPAKDKRDIVLDGKLIKD